MSNRIIPITLAILGAFVIMLDPFCWFFEMMISYENESDMTLTTINAAYEITPDAATLNTVMTDRGIDEWGEPPWGYAWLIHDTLEDVRAAWLTGYTDTITTALQIGGSLTNTTIIAEYGDAGFQVPLYLIWNGPPPDAYGLTPGDRLVVACMGFELAPEGDTFVPLLNGGFQCADYICPLETPDITVAEPLCASGISPTPTPTPTPRPTATPNYGCCERDLIPPDPITGNDEECRNYPSGGGCPWWGGWEQQPGEACQANGDCD